MKYLRCESVKEPERTSHPGSQSYLKVAADIVLPWRKSERKQ